MHLSAKAWHQEGIMVQGASGARLDARVFYHPSKLRVRGVRTLPAQHARVLCLGLEARSRGHPRCGCVPTVTIGMAPDRDEFRSSGGGETTIVLPDMPPGDPPLQHDAIQYRQTIDTIFAGAGVLGVIGGNWPTEAMTVEENFPIHLLPVPDAATMSPPPTPRQSRRYSCTRSRIGATTRCANGI